MADLEVPVHHFAWCLCEDERFFGDHLILRTSRRRVAPGQAVAISYAIGDFDRHQHSFGHDDGHTPKTVKLMFGSEWDIPQLMAAFARLCEGHGAIWFDQLSITQDEASIALQLQDMPEIYRMFEVIVLIPDAPCKCLEPAIKSWHTSDPSYTDKHGDFDIEKLASRCPNALPVSSYNFRLWTKQEFTYARKISIFYCGPSGGSCSQGLYNWRYHTSRIPTREAHYLSSWARRKYEECVRRGLEDGDHPEETAWSLFRDTHDAGRYNLLGSVDTFCCRRDLASVESNFNRRISRYASFMLGEKLERHSDDFQNIFIFENLHSQHVASKQQDFALAVLPSMHCYQLPELSQGMTLPELIDDGLEQYEQSIKRRCHSKLPKGLFELAADSYRCKPSLYLREQHIKDVGDVYGALRTDAFNTLISCGTRATIRFRDTTCQPVPPRSRLPRSQTYKEAMGNGGTAKAYEFVRAVSKISFAAFGKSQNGDACAAWAGAIIRGEVSAPPHQWPSLAHEKAIFAASLHTKGCWGLWPEVDHERVCFELMCDYVCIHPDVAREKRLGLVVKTDEPPCMGFVNAAVYDGMRQVERHRQEHSVEIQCHPTWDNTLFPEDWVTIMITHTSIRRALTFEAIRSDSVVHPEDVDGTPTNVPVAKYMVVGVWFWCEQDDPCIGAEVAGRGDASYDAVLL